MPRLTMGTLLSLALGTALFLGCNSDEAPPASPPSGATPGNGGDESHPPEHRNHGDGQASAGEPAEKQPATTPTGHTRNEVAENGHDHARHGRADMAGQPRNEHGRHDHRTDGDRKDEHRHHAHREHHGHGEHRHNETAPEGSVKIGDVVPDFLVQMLDGQSVKLSELQKAEGRTAKGVVVLSFWCTTCHSCRDMEHLLARLHQDYQGQAAVIALAANADETAGTVTAFIEETGLELPIVLDPSGHTADLFGVNRTTTTVVIDGDRALRYCGQFRHNGGGSAEEALKSVLAGNDVAIQTTPHNG